MTQKTATPEPKASSTWEHLEDFVREHVQQFIQALLEEEVTELLGRTKSVRREAVDATPGYRNGGSAIQVVLSEDSCYSGSGIAIAKIGGRGEYAGSARSMSPM